jgi:hypothetical protein
LCPEIQDVILDMWWIALNRKRNKNKSWDVCTRYSGLEWIELWGDTSSPSSRTLPKSVQKSVQLNGSTTTASSGYCQYLFRSGYMRCWFTIRSADALQSAPFFFCQPSEWIFFLECHSLASAYQISLPLVARSVPIDPLALAGTYRFVRHFP